MAHDPIKIAQKLITLKSYGGADEPFGYIKEMLESHGAHVDIVEYEGVKNLHATTGKGNPGIGFNGHYDTVPPGKDWTLDPLEPRLKDGKLFGLGASDMKGGLACMLAAILDISDLDLGRGIAFQAVGGEEEGGEKGTGIMVKKGYTAKRMVIGEPSGNAVENEHKSFLVAKIRMFGKSAHGSRVYAGSNAIVKMADKIRMIRDEGRLRFTCRKDEITDVTSCNVGLIRGGTVANMIASECTAELDIRAPANEDLEQVISYLKEHFDEVSVLRQGAGMFTDPEDPIITASKRIAEQVLGTEVIVRKGIGACDGRYFAKTGIPTVKMGPCGFDEHGNKVLHQKDEFVPAEELQKWKEIYKRVALHFSNM